MENGLVTDLKGFLDGVAAEMELYVPRKSGQHYVFNLYDGSKPVELNSIRVCTPVKEFLFPLREMAATSPQPLEPDRITPFAVFGLKDCDLRSIEILDKVFKEEEFEDPFYRARREKMFIISADCTDIGESCFCSLFGGKPYADAGFDLNVSPTAGGFIIEAGSDKGRAFLERNSRLFTEVGAGAVARRDEKREEIRRRLEQRVAQTVALDGPVKDIVQNSQDSRLFDEVAEACVECQACTRVCPTCHCFYLYDVNHEQYFSKMKMWDSCMRMAYAAVAGGANPRKVLGDRMKHRLLHKFVYFAERYGVNMCVGCGRCIDADAGGMDLRDVLKRLGEHYKKTSGAKV
jgi:sulfhydrogenase subunit beta (sulfur reductase)